MKQVVTQKDSRRKKVIWALALLSLAAAYLYGFSQRGSDVLPRLHETFAQGTRFEKISASPLLYQAHAEGQEDILDYVVVEEAQGYGGPLHVATVIDPSGEVERTIVVDNKETPSWFRKVLEGGFFEQFSGRKVSDPLELGEDVDAVTRATVSSRAFTEAIREGSHTVGRKYLGLEIAERKAQWNFGRHEIILLALYGVMLLGALRRIPRLRYLTLAAGMVLIGFYLRTPISLSSFSSLMLGYFKPIKAEVFWWLLVGGTLTMTFLVGKNLYCHWLCPFGAIQEGVAKVGGIEVRLGRRAVTLAKNVGLFLTWLALMIVFVTSNGPLGSYEPFSALFGYEGIGAQWYMLPMVILGSFVLPRFWCRFFCPVGVVLNLIPKVRRTLKGIGGGGCKGAAPVVEMETQAQRECPRKAA